MRPAQPHEILLPVRTRFMVMTIALALLGNLAQWEGVLRWVRPDFVAVVLLYWSVHQPRRLSFTAAWLIGLAVDIADASLFGQHALAYTTLVFAGVVLHRRVQMFGWVGQVAHVLPLLWATDLVMLLVRTLAGAGYPGWAYFAGSVAGAALWIPVSFLFRLPHIPNSDPDHGLRIP